MKRNNRFKNKRDALSREQLFLSILIFSAIIAIPFEGLGRNNRNTTVPDHNSTEFVSDFRQSYNQNNTPVGLFTYNKWIDLNENLAAEQYEFFGLGKKIFTRGEPLCATLYDPYIIEDTQIKIRIWDDKGNLISSEHRTYLADRLFTFSHIEKILSPGSYILTINPGNTQTTYHVSFILEDTPDSQDDNLDDYEPLPEGLIVFSEWLDKNNDLKFTKDEIIGLNRNQFEPGDINMAVGLNLPPQEHQVVFQIWDPQGNLLGMTISNLNTTQYYSLTTDTLNNTPNFLSSLSKAMPGKYRITAVVDNQELTSFEQNIYLQTELDEEFIAGQNASFEAGFKKDIDYPIPKGLLLSNINKMAPITFDEEMKGFFLFSDYIDLNKDSIQQEYEFIKLREESYNTKIDNIHAQFHLPKFQNQKISLKIIDQYGYSIIEQSVVYQDKPYVFEISNAQFRLAPGQYYVQLEPENAEIKFEETLTVR